jgi:hypothetical protein
VAVAAEAGSAAPSGSAALSPFRTMAEDDKLSELAVLGELTGWMSRASVRPTADAGQFWVPLGVPR